MAETRRNPKRKGAEAPPAIGEAPEYILEQSLRPLTDEEREEWQGWVELESDPSFFSYILRELGISCVRVQEVFTLDEVSLGSIPKPVYGLIFLYQYEGTPDDNEDTDEDHDIWFANQTVDNSCATVALLNIIMNQDFTFGEEMHNFRAITQDLPPALRGFELGRNVFIRSIHNSFARRMDFLESDLCLENEASTRKSPKKTKKAAPKRKPAKRPKRQANSAFHFTAFVSSSGSVYELDGLKTRPVKLGDIAEGEDFTMAVRPHIEARMLEYHEDQIVFNLLALCKSPFAANRDILRDSLASIACLDEIAPFKDSNFVGMVAEEDKMALTAYELAQVDLSPQDIADHVLSPDRLQEIETSTATASGAYQLRTELVNAARAAMSDCTAEFMVASDNMRRAENRRKDYRHALHVWLSKLAEKGVLENLIKDSQ